MGATKIPIAGKSEAEIESLLQQAVEDGAKSFAKLQQMPQYQYKFAKIVAHITSDYQDTQYTELKQ